MSCKVTPWGAAAVVRNLSIRTRRPHTQALRAARPEIRPIKQTTPFLITRRGLADDTTTRQPPSDPSSALPPSLSFEQPLSVTPPPEPTTETSEYVPQPPEVFAPNFLNAEALDALEKAAAGRDLYDDGSDGLLFDVPGRLGKHEKLQDRYHPVVDQVTKLLMKDGKLSKAQRHTSLILNYLRTAPTPKISPLRPLLPGSPPASQLPLNPLLYLTLAIDSVAPLIRIRSIKGAAGGGMALDVPEPMPVRTRRRHAVMWILDAVRKKRSMGSGRAQFATRFAQELVAVVEGKSGVWARRDLVHKQGTATRANLNHHALRKRK
ncbi:ribosomal protein S7 [Hypoxylon trugodes]|uniref:ribosomal protein S7 n=1 Tax=Hypoxylon trugodes TaxID=326681 RepID=UPI0021A04239|nr:ribosomal protein S7 [Hypoxylon trugodes]KAI1387809.1 ribosomal protein S7 [Hypoxylon trugodes]